LQNAVIVSAVERLEKLSAQQSVELRRDIAKEAALRRLRPSLTNN
jgi:hypothetical protein